MEIEQFNSILSNVPQGSMGSKCPCQISDDPADLPKVKSYKGSIAGVRLDELCECGDSYIDEALKSESWSCPFCCDILCDRECFREHTYRNHSLARLELAVPQTSIGTHWCPLCRKTPFPNQESTITAGSLYDKIMETFQNITTNAQNINNVAVQNTVCFYCKKSKKKKLSIPCKLESLLFGGAIYSPEATIPPFLLIPTILLGDILKLEDIDGPAFLTILLQQQSFRESPTSSSYYAERHIENYTKSIWKTILNHNEEKSISLVGSKTLAHIRADIAIFDNGMKVTMLPFDLQRLIRSYTHIQHWYFESIISQIHKDALQYGPRVQALLSVIGPNILFNLT